MFLGANNLVLGAFISLVGMVLLVYGQRAARGPHVVGLLRGLEVPVGLVSGAGV